MTPPILGIFASAVTGGVSTTSFESIATVSVGSGGAADVTFSSIPATYTHLQIRYAAQDNRGTYGISEIFMQFNADTSGAYAYHDIYGGGSSAIAEAGSSQTSIQFLGTLGTTTGGTFGANIIDVLDYANTNKYKTTRGLAGVDFNGVIAGYGGRVGLYSGLWQNTAAITSIKLYSPNGNIQQYSNFALYGIKGA